MAATLTTAQMMGPKPSAHQQGIYDWVVNGYGDAIGEAVAGSGKTTVLVGVAKLIRSARAIFFAFNKHITTELTERLAGTTMQAMTIHGFGYRHLLRAYKGVKVEANKYRRLCEDQIEATLEPRYLGALAGDDEARKLIKGRIDALRKLVDFARLTLTPGTDRAALLGLMARYGITTDSDTSDDIVCRGVAPVLARGLRGIERRIECDFTDMVWAPIALNLPIDRFDWVLVDESQDLNNCQSALVQRARGLGGRMLFVGDRHQAIYGFAGAATDSIDRIVAATGARSLPLSICYRCPRRHVALAKLLVPQIEAAPDAIEGTVVATREANLPGIVKEGALILCRTTAPLVSLCFTLIAHGKPARVRGRDIAKGLIDLAERIAKIDPTPDHFLGLLDAYEAQQLERLAQREGTESAMATLADTCEALEICWRELSGEQSLAALKATINNIFSDDAASIWLSTIHRAKGLEADDVIILRPDLLPFSHPKQTPEDFAQELNLVYVALTRAKKSLTFAHPDDTKVLPSEDADNLDL